ncbi:MAG: RelA/SpoT family protein [Holosporales bacterium]|jgi:GTP pyrophosphokinase|nr:RelA/SpoT family protein [Holosporales bacterium]
MLLQLKLIEAIRVYIPHFDEELLDRVYRFAKNAHEEQKRASGEDYFSHPAAVALIAANMRLDFPSVLAALLHDTVEDTHVTIEAIHALFGTEIAELVDGVTKIGKVQFSSKEKYKAENFRKFIAATAGDARVLLIKLCDRLHNMRTLYHIPDPQRRRMIAAETLDIFSVLASRMGIQAVQNELEELAFAELYPEDYQRITHQIDEFCAKDVAIIDRIIHEFDTIFRERDMFPRIVGRNKTPYSIWTKLQKRHVVFEQLTDIVAFRIILPDVESCYRALGILHTCFQAVPARFKDYISTPKPNGYRSIHTTILGPLHKPVEVQIRTVDMDNMANNGKCSHWVYKKDATGRIGAEQYRWLKGILDIFQNTTAPEEILSNAQSEIFNESIFCFTPRGDLISLPVGATPVDFAYAVHTHIGNSCVGARVDGRITPLNTPLQSGSHVEILIDENQSPSALWKNFVITGKAKACIGKYIRMREKTEFVLLGQSLLQQHFSCLQEGFSYKDVMTQLVKGFECATQRGLQEAIGRGRILPSSLHQKICHMNIPLKPSVDPMPINVSDFILGIAVHHADCCHPIAQDHIVGELVPERGLVVHTSTCARAPSHKNASLPVFWGEDAPANTRMHAQLHIVVLNQPGSFAMVFNVLRDREVRISNINTTYRVLEFLDAIADIEVENKAHLAETIASLRTCPRVHSVEEIK